MNDITSTTAVSYSSPATQPGLWARLFPSLAFYPSIFGIVADAARKAKAGKYDGAEWVHDSLRVVRLFERVGTRFRIEGMEHFKNLHGPCVFVGNHMSTLETFVLPCLIQPVKDVNFVVKKSLADYPVFKHVLHARNPIIVSRANPREDLAAVLEGGEERLRAGTSVIVFPQSTRSATFDEKLFNTIGVKLARRAGVPVVPVALKTDAWGCGGLIKDFGPIDPAKTVHFRFGEPLSVTGNGKDEHARICAFIASAMQEWETEPAANGLIE